VRCFPASSWFRSSTTWGGGASKGALHLPVQSVTLYQHRHSK
jgi:hypothetical protein